MYVYITTGTDTVQLEVGEKMLNLWLLRCRKCFVAVVVGMYSLKMQSVRAKRC